MHRRHYTREFLQGEADRLCADLKAKGFNHVPKSVRVYTIGALHDAAIGAPPGFSTRYSAVAGRSKEGRATVYVKLMVSEYAHDPRDLVIEQVQWHVRFPRALNPDRLIARWDGIVAYGNGKAFVTRSDRAAEARFMFWFGPEYASVDDDTWETDPKRLKLVEQMRDREAYPQDYAPDDG